MKCFPSSTSLGDSPMLKVQPFSFPPVLFSLLVTVLFDLPSSALAILKLPKCYEKFDPRALCSPSAKSQRSSVQQRHKSWR